MFVVFDKWTTNATHCHHPRSLMVVRTVVCLGPPCTAVDRPTEACRDGIYSLGSSSVHSKVLRRVQCAHGKACPAAAPLNGHGDDDGDAATLVVVVDVPEADLLSHYYHYRLQSEGVGRGWEDAKSVDCFSSPGEFVPSSPRRKRNCCPVHRRCSDYYATSKPTPLPGVRAVDTGWKLQKGNYHWISPSVLIHGAQGMSRSVHNPCPQPPVTSITLTG